MPRQGEPCVFFFWKIFVEVVPRGPPWRCPRGASRPVGLEESGSPFVSGGCRPQGRGGSPLCREQARALTSKRHGKLWSRYVCRVMGSLGRGASRCRAAPDTALSRMGCVSQVRSVGGARQTGRGVGRPTAEGRSGQGTAGRCEWSTARDGCDRGGWGGDRAPRRGSLSGERGAVARCFGAVALEAGGREEAARPHGPGAGGRGAGASRQRCAGVRWLCGAPDPDGT